MTKREEAIWTLFSRLLETFYVGNSDDYQLGQEMTKVLDRAITAINTAQHADHIWSRLR